MMGEGSPVVGERMILIEFGRIINDLLNRNPSQFSLYFGSIALN